MPITPFSTASMTTSPLVTYPYSTTPFSNTQSSPIIPTKIYKPKTIYKPKLGNNYMTNINTPEKIGNRISRQQQDSSSTNQNKDQSFSLQQSPNEYSIKLNMNLVNSSTK